MPYLKSLLVFLFVCATSVAAEEAEPSVAEPTSADIPARIGEAEVGEWVLYRRADGSRLRLTVIEKWQLEDDTTLIILNEIIHKGKKRARTTREEVSVKQATADIRELGEEDRVRRADILVQGRKIEVIVVDFIENGRLVRQSYLSPRIPVYGLVRGTEYQNNKTRIVLSLIDYGFAEDSIE